MDKPPHSLQFAQAPRGHSPPRPRIPAARPTAPTPSMQPQAPTGIRTFFEDDGEGVFIGHAFDSIREEGSVAGPEGEDFSSRPGKR